MYLQKYLLCAIRGIVFFSLYISTFVQYVSVAHCERTEYVFAINRCTNMPNCSTKTTKHFYARHVHVTATRRLFSLPYNSVFFLLGFIYFSLYFDNNKKNRMKTKQDKMNERKKRANRLTNELRILKRMNEQTRQVHNREICRYVSI